MILCVLEKNTENQYTSFWYHKWHFILWQFVDILTLTFSPSEKRENVGILYFYCPLIIDPCKNYTCQKGQPWPFKSFVGPDLRLLDAIFVDCFFATLCFCIVTAVCLLALIPWAAAQRVADVDRLPIALMHWNPPVVQYGPWWCDLHQLWGGGGPPLDH